MPRHSCYSLRRAREPQSRGASAADEGQRCHPAQPTGVERKPPRRQAGPQRHRGDAPDQQAAGAAENTHGREITCHGGQLTWVEDVPLSKYEGRQPKLAKEKMRLSEPTACLILQLRNTPRAGQHGQQRQRKRTHQCDITRLHQSHCQLHRSAPNSPPASVGCQRTFWQTPAPTLANSENHLHQPYCHGKQATP